LLLAFGPTDDAKGSGTCNAGHSASRLPFAAAFPPSPTRPQEDARIPAAYAGAWLAAERIAELCGGRLIHTAAIKAPLLMAPWSPGREELVAFGAQVGFVTKNSRGKKRIITLTTTSRFGGRQVFLPLFCHAFFLR